MEDIECPRNVWRNIWRSLSVHSVYMEVIECPRCVCGGYWAIWTSVLPFTYMGLGEKQAWLLAGLLCFTFLKTEILKKGLCYPYL